MLKPGLESSVIPPNYSENHRKMRNWGPFFRKSSLVYNSYFSLNYLNKLKITLYEIKRNKKNHLQSEKNAKKQKKNVKF